MIKLEAITKTYADNNRVITVLSNINLELKYNEFIAIMGPSGSGKSTLLNLLGLLDWPTSGAYYLENINISKNNDEQFAYLRSHLFGFIFQSYLLLPQLTVLENIALPLHYQANAKNVVEKCYEMLSKFGLEKFAHRRPLALSGGQQQRVAIARALITNPKIILADEPTGALDSATGQAIMDLLHALNQQDKKTIIIVTHDQKIADQCQRKVLLQDGQIVDDY